MFKFLLFCGLCLLGSFSGFGQSTGNQPYLKLTHLGTQGRRIVDLYLSSQVPDLNPAQGIDSHYRMMNVCLLPEADLAALVRYAESYAAKTKSDSKNEKYGTFEITIGPDATHKLIYTCSKTLPFLSGAVQMLQRQPQQADNEEALRRLESTIQRLNAG